VGDDIGVAVAHEAAQTGESDAAEHQGASGIGTERVRIEARSDA
jgi:hypothetical protein